MLPKSFKSAKCKTSLKLAIARIKLLRNKRAEQVWQMKKELAQLLEKGQEQAARVRVEHCIQEEKTMAAYELIQLYCELLVARMPIIESQKKCPLELKEAITGLIFSAPRCADIPELVEVSKNFSAKYGKDFVVAVRELRPECGVNSLIVEKLSARPSDINTKNKLLSEVAKEHNIKWEATVLEETVKVRQSDVLPGPSSFPSGSSEGSFGIRSPSSHSQTQPQESAQKAQTKDGGRFSPVPGRTSIPDRKYETEVSLGRQKWAMNFSDATSAAQAAAESAELASFAARAAVELASRGDASGFPTQPRSQSKSPRNKDSMSWDHKPNKPVSENERPLKEQDQKEVSLEQDRARRSSDFGKKSPRVSDDEAEEPSQRTRFPKFDSPESESEDEVAFFSPPKTSTKVESPGSKATERWEQRTDGAGFRNKRTGNVSGVGDFDRDQTSTEHSKKKSPRSPDTDLPKFDSPKSDSVDDRALFSDPKTSAKVPARWETRTDGTGYRNERTGKDFGVVDLDKDQVSAGQTRASGVFQGSRSSSDNATLSDKEICVLDRRASKEYKSDAKTRRSSSSRSSSVEQEKATERKSAERKNDEALFDDAPAVDDKEQKLFLERFLLRQSSGARAKDPPRSSQPSKSPSTDEEEDAGGLKLGRLTGGLRNRAQLSGAIKLSPPSDSLGNQEMIKPGKNVPPRAVESDDSSEEDKKSYRETVTVRARAALSPRNPEPKIEPGARNSDSGGVWARPGGVSVRTSPSGNKPKPPDPETSLGGPVRAEEDRPKPPASPHVHPKLPDFESLQAHFRALRSNRR
ncbi:uncharacterized protein LOC144703683 [Wolffia australiana]